MLNYAEINWNLIQEHVGKDEGPSERIKLDLGLGIFEEDLDVLRLGFDALFSILREQRVMMILV